MLVRTCLTITVALLLGCGSQITDDRGGAASGASSGGASSGGQGGGGSASAGSGVPGSGDCKPGDPPTPLSSGEDNPLALTIDADYVYFTTAPADMCAASAVKRVSKHGGMPEVVGKGMRQLSALAVDDKNIYWPDDPVSLCTQPADPGYTMFAAPKAGGAPLLFPFATQFQPTQDIAVDEAGVYWVSWDQDSVRRAPKTGGKPVVLFTSEDPSFAVALDDANVYWAGGAGIWRVPKAGGASSMVASVPLMGTPSVGLSALRVASGSVYFGAYWACQGADCAVMGRIKRVSVDGGAVVDVASTVDKQPVRMALDEQSVYWTSASVVPAGELPSGGIMRAPRSGGSAQQIANGQTPHGIAVDASCVYWTDTGDGTVMKAPK